MNGNSQQLATTSERLERFVVPTYLCGIGGKAKAVLPRLDALYQRHYGGSRPEVLPFSLFDFDEAEGAATVDGQTHTTAAYLKALPKKPLLDVARRLRRNNAKAIEACEPFRSYVHLPGVRAVDAPGLNLFVQGANLAWRLVHESHVLPELTAKLRHLNPAPNTLECLGRDGIAVASRSVIWVIAGGASTTGPSGLIPILCELKRLKPANTSLFAIVFAPRSYREKTSQRQVKGKAIYRATMTQLLTLFDGDQSFDQPYGLDGYRIQLDEPPFDQLLLVDGSFAGGRRDFDGDELAELIALLLFKCTVGPLGEKLLSLIGDLNRTPEGIQ